MSLKGFKFDLKKVSSFTGVKVPEMLGVELGSNRLKLSLVKVLPYKREIVNLLSLGIAGLGDTEVSKALRVAFEGLHARNPEIISIIPSASLITKNIEIPSTDPKEIREIINLQAGRHTPYSREEIIVDYIEIGTYKHSYTKILLVIAARSTIKRQVDILEKAGMRLEKIFFSAEAIARYVSRTLKPEPPDSPQAIVHIDDTSTDFILALGQKAIFVRSIPIGSQQLGLEGERYLVRFADEIKRSLEAYQSEDVEKLPPALVLTGVTEGLNLEPALKTVVNLPVKIFPYLRYLPFAEALAKNPPSAKSGSFLSVASALLVGEELRIDLVPEEIKLRKALEQRGKELIKSGIFIFIIFILTFSILLSKIFFKTINLNKLNDKYKSLSREVDTLEKDFTKIEVIRNYLGSRGYSLEVLTELHKVAPLDLKLSDIRFDEQGKISLRGISESMSIVFSFVENLEKSSYFKEAKTKYTTKRKEGAVDVVDFEINCLLEKEDQQ